MADILYTIIIYPITQIIEFVFVFAQKLFKETGLSIICVSGAVSVLCLPLYMIAEGWQDVERNIQKKLAPKIARIKAAFKGDERYMVMAAYYRQNHYHPVYALRSTFGLLIQIPFFIAAYSYLSHLETLKGAAFLFISDLGSPDKLIPVAGGINLLPILMTLINCAAGAIYTRGFAIKDKVQLYGIAVIFLLLLYNSPAGLVLYWTLNNVFSLVKNAYLKINFSKKHLLLSAAVSLCAFLLIYYSLFVHHGSPKVRALIAFLSAVIGVFPWIIPFLTRIAAKTKPVNLNPKEVFSLFIFSLCILWALTGLFLPSMLIGSSPQEFSFIDSVASPLYFIFNTSLQSFGLFIFWPLMIYLLLSKKNKKIFSVVVLILSFSAICNVFIFPGNYGTISSDLVFSQSVSHTPAATGLNIFFLAVLLFIILFIYIKGGKKILSSLSVVLFIAVIFMSCRNVYLINAEFKKLAEYYNPEPKNDETLSPIFHLSKNGKNVLVLMLDMAESVFVPYIFEESPDLYQKYEGFVYFPNTVTFNGWTKGGAPPIFGGYEYTPEGINQRPDTSVLKKTNESLLLMPRIFSEADFSVTITDPPYADNNWIPDLRIYDSEENISAHITDKAYTDHWLKLNNIVLPTHSEVLKRNILWYAIFREVPLAFRQAIYYTGSWCAPFSEHRMRLFLNGYAVLDSLSELTDFDSPKDNSAVIMVNNTTHENLFLQAPDYKPQLNVTNYGSSRFSKEVWYHVNAAAIKRLADYFDFLKAHNVYDNTRIILVADHAGLDASYVTKTRLPFHVDQFNSVLMVKDFNAQGNMKTDTAFMSTADVPTLAMEGLIENPVNPFTGNIISSERKKDPLLILVNRAENKTDTELDIGQHNTYYVHDNIFNEKNWSKPDKAP